MTRGVRGVGAKGEGLGGGLPSGEVFKGHNCFRMFQYMHRIEAVSSTRMRVGVGGSATDPP